MMKLLILCMALVLHTAWAFTPQWRLLQRTCLNFENGNNPIPSLAPGAGISWQRGPSIASRCPNKCCVRGTLALEPPEGATYLIVRDMDIRESTGWVFNFGDSVSNDGHCGDYASSPVGWNAEFHEVNQRIQFCDGGDSPSDITRTDWTTLHSKTHKLSIGVNRFGPGHISNNVWAHDHTGTGYSFFAAPPIPFRLFYWNTFYLGVNQVITGRSDRKGTGFCSVCIEWYKIGCRPVLPDIPVLPHSSGDELPPP